jgi:eukaryotic-like serine/threonine-protein kinase
LIGFTPTKELVAMMPLNGSPTTTDPSTGFLEEIRRSSILTERQLEKLQSSTAEGNYPPEPAEVASRLVKDGVLTQYQSRQILKGKLQSLVFGGYVILDFLGKGTMGKVYKARHRMMGRVVALKVLDPRYVSSERTLARFQREMQLVGRLDHPNVVRAFDADRVVDCHFIAMEYAEGFTLDDLLKAKGALPPADVVYFCSQAADGLAHAHARGVLHRDIKPSNLLLTEGRKLKILDFGLGTLVEKEDLPAELTAAGITVGTPDYISPEQARMLKLDGRSDLYSLGCTMYHLLSGKLPFQGESSMDCIVGRITGQGIPINDVRPGLPPRLVETIEKMMATDPDDRFQTADEAATALRSMLRPKNASRQVPTVEASASEPAKAPKATPIPEAPTPPVRAEIPVSKPKLVSLRSHWTDLGKKTKQVLAASAVAVAAVALIVVTLVLLRPSQDAQQASQEVTSQTNDVPTLPAGKTDARQPSAVVETPKPAATVVATKKDVPSPALPALGASVRQPSLVIENPKPGVPVGMKEELTGRLESEGWPVIFVQADLPGQPWWCQAPVTKLDGGRFTAKVVFGDELTPSGMTFRIAAIVLPTREEALKFELGSKQPVLPAGLPQTAEVVFTHR